MLRHVVLTPHRSCDLLRNLDSLHWLALGCFFSNGFCLPFPAELGRYCTVGRFRGTRGGLWCCLPSWILQLHFPSRCRPDGLCRIVSAQNMLMFSKRPQRARLLVIKKSNYSTEIRTLTPSRLILKLALQDPHPARLSQPHPAWLFAFSAPPILIHVLQSIRLLPSLLDLSDHPPSLQVSLAPNCCPNLFISSNLLEIAN